MDVAQPHWNDNDRNVVFVTKHSLSSTSSQSIVDESQWNRIERFKPEPLSFSIRGGDGKFLFVENNRWVSSSDSLDLQGRQLQ